MANRGEGGLSARSKITGYFVPGTGTQTKLQVKDDRQNAPSVIRPGKSLLFQNKEETVPRKSLQTLQPSVPNGLTRPGTGDSKKSRNQKILPKQPGHVNVFVDPETAAASSKPAHEEKCTSTDPDITNCKCSEPERTAEEEAIHLMGSVPVPEDYWKDIAERRREALSEALEENEQLHTSIHELQVENERLSELAEQAEYFASILKTLTQDEKKNDEEGGTEEESDQEETAPSESSEKESVEEPEPNEQSSEKTETDGAAVV